MKSKRSKKISFIDELESKELTDKKAIKFSQEELEQARKEVQEDCSGFDNGHSGYMVVGVDKEQFLDWAALKYAQMEHGLFDELICNVQFEEGNDGITVAYFDACEKYSPQLNDIIEKVFPDAIVYGWGCWDSCLIEAPEDVYTTELDTTFEDGGNLRIDIKATDKKSGCSFYVGDLICFNSADECVNPDDETYEYLTGLLNEDEKAQVEDCLRECQLYHDGRYDEDIDED